MIGIDFHTHQGQVHTGNVRGMAMSDINTVPPPPPTTAHTTPHTSPPLPESQHGANAHAHLRTNQLPYGHHGHDDAMLHSWAACFISVPDTVCIQMVRTRHLPPLKEPNEAHEADISSQGKLHSQPVHRDCCSNNSLQLVITAACPGPHRPRCASVPLSSSAA